MQAIRCPSFEKHVTSQRVQKSGLRLIPIAVGRDSVVNGLGC